MRLLLICLDRINFFVQFYESVNKYFNDYYFGICVKFAATYSAFFAHLLLVAAYCYVKGVRFFDMKSTLRLHFKLTCLIDITPCFSEKLTTAI